MPREACLAELRERTRVTAGRKLIGNIAALDHVCCGAFRLGCGAFYATRDGGAV